VLEDPNELVILVAKNVKQVKLVLPSQSKMLLFQKKSGCPFKCWQAYSSSRSSL